MIEVWKKINGYEDYLVSNLGRVKSVKFGKERIINLSLNKPNGYYKVSLSMNGISACKTIHRLVAEAFLPNPNDYEDINHKDENKLNNFVWVNEDGTIDIEKSNLEWCSHRKNMELWSVNNFTHKEVHHHKRVLQYSPDGKFIKEWKGCREAGRELNICWAGISRSCRSGYRAGGYVWRFS